MAPTTLHGQVTSTTPKGRQGQPLHVAELLTILDGTNYVERCSVSNATQIRRAKKAIKHGFELQLAGAMGLSLIEILSPCPTYWRMTPVEAMEWIEKEMSKVFPLKVFKDVQ